MSELFVIRELQIADRGYIVSTWLRQLGKRTKQVNALCVRAIDEVLDQDHVAVVCYFTNPDVIVGWATDIMSYIPKELQAHKGVIQELLDAELDRRYNP